MSPHEREEELERTGECEAGRGGSTPAPETDPLPTERIGREGKSETPLTQFEIPRTGNPQELSDHARRGERISLLGRGGYGQVWKVRYLNSEEAWKFLPKRPGGDFHALRETLNARRVDHPNIVRIQDIAEDEEHYILRMDLVRGRDLYRVVNEDGVLPPTTACRFALQIAAALEEAHRAGVLHLDLKPSNLILREDGESVMITDFGVSASLNREILGFEPGRLPGTPYFMAPEQLQGSAAELGPGVDIWALGITLYYLLSRTYPFAFEGDDASVILEEDPCPLTDVVPYVDEELWGILQRMLRRDPRERLASMREVRAAFASYLEDVKCPACGTLCRRDPAPERCANPKCPAPEQVKRAAEVRRLMLEAGDLFARCEFEEAVSVYEKAVRAAGREFPEDKRRAKRLIAAAEAAAKELARRLEAVRFHLDAGRLVRAAREIDEGRRRFSRASDLIVLRREIQEEVRRRAAAFEEEVSARLKAARFAGAWRLVEEIEGYLRYEPLRRLLAGPEDDGEFERRLEAQKKRIARKEWVYRAAREDLERRLRALELDRAVSSLQRLQNHFPSPERVARIRLLSELQESLAFVERCDIDALCRLLAEERFPSEPFEIAALERHCDHLLEHLDPEVSPGLARVVEIREQVRRVIRLLASRRERLEEERREAEARGDLRGELLALEGLLQIACGTDLLAPEEAAQIRSRHQKLVRLRERAERKFREGEELLAKGDPQGAVLAFEAAETIAPGLLPEVPERVRDARERLEESRRLGEDLEAVFQRIEAGESSFEEFRTYFRLARRLEVQGEQELWFDFDERAQRVLGRLLAAGAEAVREAKDDRKRLEIVSTTIDVLHEVRSEVLERLLGDKSTWLDQGILELFYRAFSPLEDTPPLCGEVEERVGRVRALMSQLARLRGVIRKVVPVGREPHPAERAGACLLAAAEAALLRLDAREIIAGIIELHSELDGFAEDAGVRGRLEEERQQLRRKLRQAALTRAVRTLRLWARKAALPAAAALATALVAGFFFHSELRGVRSALAQRVLSPLLGGLVEAMPEDVRARLGGDEEALVQLLAPAELIGGGGESASGGKAAVLMRFSAARRRLEALGRLLSGAGDDPQWRKRLEEERLRLFAAAGESLRNSLRLDLEAIAERALAIDPRRSGLDIAREMRGAVENALLLAQLVEPEGGVWPPPDLRKALEWVRAFEELLQRSASDAAGGGEKLWILDLPPAEDGAMVLLAHLAYLHEETYRLAAEAAEAGWNRARARRFESRLHERFKAFAEYAEAVSAQAYRERELRALASVRPGAGGGGELGRALAEVFCETLARALKGQG